MFEQLKAMFGGGGGGEADPLEHPALGKVNSQWEVIKHVAKKTIKTAAKWAIIGGIVLGALALAPAGVTGIVGGLLSTLSFGLINTAGAGAALLGSYALKGLTIGAVAGAVKGALSGITSADEAVDEAQERAILNYDRGAQRTRSQQMYAMQMQQRMGGGMGLSPGTLPMGRDAGGQGLGQG